MGIHWVNNISLRPFCDQSHGAMTFSLDIVMANHHGLGPSSQCISLHVEAPDVEKFKRIADFIESVMNEGKPGNDLTDFELSALENNRFLEGIQK